MVPALVPIYKLSSPEGAILRPGDAIPGDSIPVKVAACILGMSNRWVAHECALGRFKTAKQNCPGGKWMIAYSEVVKRRKESA